MLETDVKEMSAMLFEDVKKCRQETEPEKIEKARSLVTVEMMSLRSIVSAYRAINEYEENDQAQAQSQSVVELKLQPISFTAYWAFWKFAFFIQGNNCLIFLLIVRAIQTTVHSTFDSISCLGIADFRQSSQKTTSFLKRNEEIISQNGGRQNV